MDLSAVRYVGLDLGKRLFSLQLQDAEGRDLGARGLRRGELLDFFATLPACTVAMEACAGAGYWCEQLAALGHRPLPLHPRAVSRLRLGHKNDQRDAALILVAARLPDARPAIVKSREQTAVLSLHRTRELVIKSEVSSSNQVLGFLLEMGSVRWKSAAELRRATPEEVDDEVDGMPEAMRLSVRSGVSRMRSAHAEQLKVAKALRRWHDGNSRSRRLAEVPGISYLAASALAASIPDPSPWPSGRAFAAFLGLVPVQHSTGGLQRLGHIGSGGDKYLRRTLFLVAWSAAMNCYRTSSGPASLVSLLERKHFYVAITAHAARLARTCCQMLTDGVDFEERPAWRVTAFRGKGDTAAGRGGETRRVIEPDLHPEP